MKRISILHFCRTIALVLVIATISLAQVSIAEQIDTPKKARRVSNRQIPIVNDPQESLETYEDAELDEEFYEDDSVVIQASCKNCASDNISNQVIESGIDSSATFQDSNLDLEGNSFADSSSMGLGCDSGTCLDRSCNSNFGLNVDSCSVFGLLVNRLHIRAESATFWSGGQQLPSLVESNQTPLFGGSGVGSDAVPGFRSDIGLWLDDYKSRAIVVRGFYGGDNDVGLVTDSNVFPNLDLPYNQPTNPLTPANVIIAQLGPPLLNGNVNANLSSTVYGGDILVKQMLARDSLGRWDWLMGYQTARLAESLTIDSRRLDGPIISPPPGTTILDIRDSFQVKNQFHGATFGFSGDVREGNWFFGGMFKLGLGNMARSVEIQGARRVEVVVTPGTPLNVDTTANGLHANSNTNSGRYEFDTFVMTPELNLTAGYRLTPRLDFTVGYNMLRLPKVTRVANALDPRLAADPGEPTAVNPAFDFREFNFTLHSLNLGLQWNY